MMPHEVGERNSKSDATRSLLGTATRGWYSISIMSV